MPSFTKYSLIVAVADHLCEKIADLSYTGGTDGPAVFLSLSGKGTSVSVRVEDFSRYYHEPVAWVIYFCWGPGTTTRVVVGTPTELDELNVSEKLFQSTLDVCVKRAEAALDGYRRKMEEKRESEKLEEEREKAYVRAVDKIAQGLGWRTEKKPSGLYWIVSPEGRRITISPGSKSSGPGQVDVSLDLTWNLESWQAIQVIRFHQELRGADD